MRGRRGQVVQGLAGMCKIQASVRLVGVVVRDNTGQVEKVDAEATAGVVPGIAVRAGSADAGDRAVVADPRGQVGVGGLAE